MGTTNRVLPTVLHDGDDGELADLEEMYSFGNGFIHETENRRLAKADFVRTDTWTFQDGSRLAIPTDFVRSVDATAVVFGVSTSASGAANTAALQAAVDFAHSAGFNVYIPKGLYLFDLVTHPNTNATWSTCVAAIRDHVKVWGAGPGNTVLKLTNGSSTTGLGRTTLTAGSQNRFFINWDPDADVAVDTDIRVEEMTLDGNAANNTTAGNVMHGIQFWNVRRCYYTNVHSKNMRGDNTSNLETFHLDFVRSQDVGMQNCRVFTDDSSSTASGVSMNFCDRFAVIGTNVTKMAHGQGFTYYASANGTTVGCFAGGNGSAGFNEEHCSDLTYVNCDSGSENSRTDSSTSSAAFTQAASNANDKGWVFLHTHGGGRIRCVNCNSRGNTTRGVGITGSVSASATTGTTGSTVVLTSALFFQPMVGNYIQLASHGWFRITAVSGSGASTTCTTDSAHGGASGDAVLIQMGQITFEGEITGNGKGIQPTDATSALKQLSMRNCDFTRAKIYDNTTDLEDIGNGSVTSIPFASGQAPAGCTDNLASTVEFYNPFPMDMMVTNAGASGVTSLRGTHPKSGAQSTGMNSGTYLVKAGGAITVNTATVANIRWFFL